MNKNRRCALIILIISNAALLIIPLLFLIIMALYNQNTSEPFCAFQRVFHLYCPGCGGTRAVRALLKFDLVGAFIYYPPLILSLPILGYLEYLLVRGVILSDPQEIRRFNPALRIIFAVFILVNFVLRNILLLNGIDLLGDIL